MAPALDLDELRARTMSATAGAQGVRGATAKELAALLDMIDEMHGEDDCETELPREHEDCTPAPDSLHASLAELHDVLARRRCGPMSAEQRSRRAAAHHRESATLA